MGKVLVGVLVAGSIFAAATWWWSADGSTRSTRLTSIDKDAVANAQDYDAAPVLWVGAEFDVDQDGTPEPLSMFREFAKRTQMQKDCPMKSCSVTGSASLGPTAAALCHFPSGSRTRADP